MQERNIIKVKTEEFIRWDGEASKREKDDIRIECKELRGFEALTHGGIGERYLP